MDVNAWEHISAPLARVLGKIGKVEGETKMSMNAEAVIIGDNRKGLDRRLPEKPTRNELDEWIVAYLRMVSRAKFEEIREAMSEAIGKDLPGDSIMVKGTVDRVVRSGRVVRIDHGLYSLPDGKVVNIISDFKSEMNDILCQIDAKIDASIADLMELKDAVQDSLRRIEDVRR